MQGLKQQLHDGTCCLPSAFAPLCSKLAIAYIPISGISGPQLKNIFKNFHTDRLKKTPLILKQMLQYHISKHDQHFIKVTFFFFERNVSPYLPHFSIVKSTHYLTQAPSLALPNRAKGGAEGFGDDLQRLKHVIQHSTQADLGLPLG